MIIILGLGNLIFLNILYEKKKLFLLILIIKNERKIMFTELKKQIIITIR